MMWTYKHNLIKIVMELFLQLFSIGIGVFLLIKLGAKLCDGGSEKLVDCDGMFAVGQNADELSIFCKCKVASRGGEVGKELAERGAIHLYETLGLS